MASISSCVVHGTLQPQHTIRFALLVVATLVHHSPRAVICPMKTSFNRAQTTFPRPDPVVTARVQYSHCMGRMQTAGGCPRHSRTAAYSAYIVTHKSGQTHFPSSFWVAGSRTSRCSVAALGHSAPFIYSGSADILCVVLCCVLSIHFA